MKGMVLGLCLFCFILCAVLIKKMSAIDQYKHHHIGFIECPSRFNIGFISIYELLQDIPGDEKDFDGKIGDILIGGGVAKCLRLGYPSLNFLMFLPKKMDLIFINRVTFSKLSGNLRKRLHFVMVLIGWGGRLMRLELNGGWPKICFPF